MARHTVNKVTLVGYVGREPDVTVEDRTVHLRKGDRVYVEGSLEYRVFEKLGVTPPIAEVYGREIIKLNGWRPAKAAGGAA